MSHQLANIQFPSAIKHVNFYPDISGNSLELLLAQYKDAKTKIFNASNLILSEDNQTITTYFEGALHHGKRQYTDLKTIFNYDDAINHLNSTFWSLAIKEIKIEEFLPAKARKEWDTMVCNQDCPMFDEDTVYSTLKTMLMERDTYLAQKVEGIFNILSPEHVTNSPSGFGGKLIIYYNSNIEYLNDLRGVVAKFMGRDDNNINWKTTEGAIDDILRSGDTGVWQQLDGGAFELKVFLKGTIHIKIHDEIVYKLNEILAFLHPTSIPSEFRKPRKTKSKKNNDLINTLLPFGVLNVLRGMECAYNFREHFGEMKIDGRKPNTIQFGHTSKASDRVKELITNVITLCGGVWIKENHSGYYQFDYDFVNTTAKEICRLGYVPDAKSHQYYPTDEYIAIHAAEILDVNINDRCLEPSAGTGNLLSFIESENITAIEISEIMHSILVAKYPKVDVVRSDFLKWASNSEQQFDKILMNPPYTNSQYLTHLDAALNLLDNGGRCVAVLPEGSKTRVKKLHGYTYDFGDLLEFNGVQIKVRIVTINKL